ncbi:MAG: hypothetical protein NTNFB02_36020 [Nitrospira sp.]
MSTFLRMPLTQMHLKPFGDQLKLMPQFFIKDTAVTPGFGNISAQFLLKSIRQDLTAASDLGDIISKRCSRLLKLSPEISSESLRVAPRIRNISPQFLSKFIGKKLAVASRFSDISPQRVGNQLEISPKDTCVAPSLGNIGL